jgi:hypothetical protein
VPQIDSLNRPPWARELNGDGMPNLLQNFEGITDQLCLSQSAMERITQPAKPSFVLPYLLLVLA